MDPVTTAALTKAGGDIGSSLLGASGKKGGPTVSGPISDRSPIHIAPLGVNLGSIVAPANQGPPENGGMGLELPSRLVTEPSYEQARALRGKRGVAPAWLLVGLAVGGAVLINFLR